MRVHDRKVLKTKIEQCEDDPKIWPIIEGYLDKKYTGVGMFSRLVDFYEGDRSSADRVISEILKYEKESTLPLQLERDHHQKLSRGM